MGRVPSAVASNADESLEFGGRAENLEREREELLYETTDCVPANKIGLNKDSKGTK